MLPHLSARDAADGRVVEAEGVADNLEGVAVDEMGLANPAASLRAPRLRNSANTAVSAGGSARRCAAKIS
jgi:hypothetical protein